MKITKYEHACVALEEQGKKLIIDPGSWTDNFGSLDNVVGVVITHVHADHFSPAHLATIAESDPGVPIYSTQEVASQLAAPQVTAVTGGQTVQVGPFTLQFFGGQHAVIHSSMPVNQNIAVLVNSSFYYPGDSFVLPQGVAVKTLALPVSAPWLKASDMMDFFAAIKPQVCFPTHNAILSAHGQELMDTFGENLCRQSGATYHSLKPGEAIEV